MAGSRAHFIYHNALIIGASEVRNLYQELNIPALRRHPMSWNFGFEWDDAQVYMHGVGGLTIDGALQNLASVDVINPEVVLLAVGGNDLSLTGHNGRPEVVGYKLSNMAEFLHEAYGVSRVIVSSLGPRFPPYCGTNYPPDYNQRVAICNQYLEAVLEGMSYACFWDHSRQFKWGTHLFLDDGVHYNYCGTKLWYKSLRGCLIKSFKDSFNY